MKFKWVIAAALWSGFVVAPAQSQAPVTPTKAVVTPGTTVSEAKSYVFQVEFFPAPDNWPVDSRGSRGTVGASFERQGDALSSARFSWNNPVTNLWAKPEPINNGQAIYELTVPVGELMTPGEYKLVAVTIGNDHPEPIPFSENVSIKIPELHLTVARFNHPHSIEAAGKPDRFTISVNQHMEDVSKNCVVQIWPHITRPDGNPVNLDSQEIHSAEQTLEFEIPEIKADAPSGVWKVDLNNQAYDPDNRHADCRWPALAPDSQHFSFKVVPNKVLVTPITAKVTASPSQRDLLRGEMNRLRAKAANIPKNLKPDAGWNRVYLISALQEAVSDLERTKNSYIKIEEHPLSLPKVNDFFDDLRKSYEAAGAAFNKKLVEGSRPNARFMEAKAESDQPPLQSEAEVIARTITRNADGYDMVLNYHVITFVLMVKSHPEEAAISYHHRGEPYKSWPNTTNSELQNLPRGKYEIRLQKDGYDDDCFEWDAMILSDPMVDRPLKPSTGAKCP
jgi:hypothetical protein